MKIKKLLPQQTEEIEIQLPAYFKNGIGYFFKINEDETISIIHPSKTNMLILTPANNEPIEKVVSHDKSSEQEWNRALKTLADYFFIFMAAHGFSEKGIPLLESEYVKD